MKIAKSIFSAITIIFGALGIAKLIPNSVSLPVAFISLAMLLVLGAKVYKEKGDKGSAYIVYALAAGLFVVAIYNIIF